MFSQLLFAIKTISDPLLWNVDSMYIEFEDNVLDTCCPNKSHISPILENFLYATTCQTDLVWIAGAAVAILYFLRFFFIREHCVALITVSPHSKLLVFLQTAYITPQNLIIGTHYMFRARCVNMGNLWHARAPLQPFQGMLHRLTTLTLQWFTYS